MHITLQSGHFDHPDRLFFSIPMTWKSVISITPDFRELLPQFFCSPHFLVNSNHLDMGRRISTGEKVDDVVLPPWAHNPHEFIQINSLALESSFVSQKLNAWIDMIFGVNQKKCGNWLFLSSKMLSYIHLIRS